MYVLCRAASHIAAFPSQLWKLPFAQVLFDSDPASAGRADPQQVEEMSQAMIRYTGHLVQWEFVTLTLLVS